MGNLHLVLACLVCKEITAFLIPNFGYLSSHRSRNSKTSDNDHWDYKDPSKWPGICTTGMSQSPINIDFGNVGQGQMEPLRFHNYSVKGTVAAHNNGHTELVQGFQNWSKQPFISGGGLGARYKLTQFHFHWDGNDRYGSEHTIVGLHYPMEVHFVHIREDLDETSAGKVPGGTAVVAVFFEISTDNSALFDLDRAIGDTRRINSEKNVTYYSPESLLPSDTSSFFRYNGSLTTPPCTENVIWTILEKPNYVTQQQLRQLRRHLTSNRGLLIENWRPTQALNGRKVFFTKTGN